MKHMSALTAIFVGFLGVFSAVASENTPLQMGKLDKTARFGCLGGCAGLLLYSASKHHFGSDFSKKDLEPMLMSAVIGLGAGIAWGMADTFQNRHRGFLNSKPAAIRQTEANKNYYYYSRIELTE